MYNVIIVDDEPVIRFGLKASIDWAQEDLLIVGDYPNGEQAWKALQEQPVDILITDIKMPLMDGLELTKRALSQSPSTKIILVSSYADFEFVREGLHLGAVDYVLKPTLEPEEFVLLLRKCCRLLEEERAIQEKLQFLDETQQKTKRDRLENAIKEVLYEQQDASCLKEQANWLQQPLVLASIRLDYVKNPNEQYEFLQKMCVLEAAQAFFYEHEPTILCFPVSNTELFACLPSGLTLDRTIEQLNQQMEEKNAGSFTAEYTEVEHIGFLQNSRIAQQATAGKDNELITKAVHYIHGHYTEELTLQKLADHVHLSRNYFSLLFKQFTGQNFIDYVIDLRIKKSKQLLSQSSLKVYEVAEQSGVKDVKYFSKLFKKVTGLSPVEYRLKQQEGKGQYG